MRPALEECAASIGRVCGQHWKSVRPAPEKCAVTLEECAASTGRVYGQPTRGSGQPTNEGHLIKKVPG